MNEQERLKIAAVAGASVAIRYKEKNWKATETEVLKHVASQLNEIVAKVDSGE
jgi:hypothetical protein